MIQFACPEKVSRNRQPPIGDHPDEDFGKQHLSILFNACPNITSHIVSSENEHTLTGITFSSVIGDNLETEQDDSNACESLPIALHNNSARFRATEQLKHSSGKLTV